MKVSKKLPNSSDDLELHSFILNNINEGVCLVRASDLNIVFANPKFERMFGYKRGELLNVPIPQITYGVRDEVRKRTQSIIAKLEKYGRNIFEIQNVKKNGTPFWCRVTATVFNHAEFGKVWVAVNEDITTEKKYKDKILQSENSLKQFLKQASDGIFIADLQGKYTYVNTFGSRMLGFSRREIVGKTIMDFVLKNDIQRLWKEREVLIKGKTVVSEWLLKRKNGTYLPVEVSAKILPDGRWLGFVRDISERKAFEEKISNSEKRFRNLFEKASDGILLFNFDRKIIDANPKVSAIFGYTKEELIGLSPSDLIDSEDKKLTKTSARAVFKGKTVITERDVLRKDGSIVAVESNLSIVGDGIVQGIIRDVTERKKAREAILALNKRIESILGSITDGFFSVDKQWRFEYFNETAKKMQFVPGKELLGRTLWEVYPNLVGTHYEKQYRKAMNSKKPLSFKIPSSVSEKTYKVHCYPTSFGLSVYFTDVTLEEEVVKRQNEFISVASHELRTPLTSIYANIQVLQKYYTASIDAKALNIIKNVSEETEKLLKLTSDILDTSTIQTGKIKLMKQENDINLLVKSAVKNIRSISKSHTFLINGKINQLISLDKVRILQVLTNLLTNAMKYSPKNGKIIVSAKEDEKNISISVQDFGVGIPKENLEAVFNKFYRTSQGRQTASGLGLGLFISYNIVKSHGGKMWVESEINKGSTFHFSIPK